MLNFLFYGNFKEAHFFGGETVPLIVKRPVHVLGYNRNEPCKKTLKHKSKQPAFKPNSSKRIIDNGTANSFQLDIIHRCWLSMINCKYISTGIMQVYYSAGSHYWTNKCGTTLECQVPEWGCNKRNTLSTMQSSRNSKTISS